MNRGEASAASGVSSKMIRHYEAAGLFPAARRTEADYRQYDVQTLRFIRHARNLGFSILEISELVGLLPSPWHDHLNGTRTRDHTPSLPGWLDRAGRRASKQPIETHGQPYHVDSRRWKGAFCASGA